MDEEARHRGTEHEKSAKKRNIQNFTSIQQRHALRYLIVLTCEISLVLLPIWTAITVHIAFHENLDLQLIILVGTTIALMLVMLAGAHVWERIKEARIRSKTQRSTKEGARIGHVRTTWKRRFWIDPSQTVKTEKTLESYLTYWAKHANARMCPQIDWIIATDGTIQEVRAISLPNHLIRPTEDGLRTLLQSLAVRNSGCVRITMNANATGSQSIEPTDISSALHAANNYEIITVDTKVH